MTMMNRKRDRIIFFTLLIFASLLTLAGCEPKVRVAVSQLDTPGHHTYAGLKLLELEKYSDAIRAFKMATQLDSNYSKAYTGMALVGIATGKLSAAADDLEKGILNAKTSDEELFVNTAAIRYHTAKKSDEKWLEKAKYYFVETVMIDSQYAPVYYFMGIAYQEALEFDQAAKMFNKVIQLKAGHIEDANNRLEFLELVHKAHPATQAGKQIALKETVSRADIAMMLAEELKIKELYQKYLPKTAQEAQTEEEKVAASMSQAEHVAKEMEKMDQFHSYMVLQEKEPVKLLANDIALHPLKNCIEAVLEAKVHGLENDPKGNFKPDEILSRGEFAIILEDILIKVSGERDIAARYVSSNSLFPDVPADMPYFTPIISVTSRGIMEAKNTKTGEFSPLKPMSGVEALLAVKKLKENLKID